MKTVSVQVRIVQRLAFGVRRSRFTASVSNTLVPFWSHKSHPVARLKVLLLPNTSH
jgi:hypothetical protein